MTQEKVKTNSLAVFAYVMSHKLSVTDISRQYFF